MEEASRKEIKNKLLIKKKRFVYGFQTNSLETITQRKKRNCLFEASVWHAQHAWPVNAHFLTTLDREIVIAEFVKCKVPFVVMFAYYLVANKAVFTHYVYTQSLIVFSQKKRSNNVTLIS